METDKENICTNCSQPILANFCHNCGNPTKLTRIDKKYALQEVFNFFEYDKGLFYTIKGMLIRPGQTVHDYLTKNRNRYTKPVTFLLLASAIYTFVTHYLKADTMLQEGFDKKNTNPISADVMSWIQDNYGYANILSIVFIVFWLKLFFRKHNYNIYEIAVMLFFVMGEAMILYLLVPINTKYFHSSTIENLWTTLVSIYTCWAIGQFFERKFSNYVKAFFGYLLGYITLTFFGAIMGIFYVILIRAK